MGFLPTAYAFTAYGWKGGNAYRNADIPLPGTWTPGPGIPGGDRTVLEAQFAYEWYDSSSARSVSRNPAFHSGAAGRLVPSLAQEGLSNRILRGFIRRAEYDPGDPKSTARLYFMYNPEQITRDYVSYLDQGALDPFNSVFQSGNLVPPPSFMDFTFSLLFDRQDEAQDARNPGVFVDYQFFDLVVRNVVPTSDPNAATTSLPDNGVMMVNPRDCTVVFSPQITVQGRPSNARVSFQRFTHRMVPTRMQIDLTMRVTYFGPMKDMVAYEREEQVAALSIPWDPNTPSPFTMTRADIETGAQAFVEQMKADMLTAEQLEEMVLSYVENGSLPPGTSAHNDANINANGGINASIAEFAKTKAEASGTKYSLAKRSQLWAWADCSSYVWGAFRDHSPPYNDDMGGSWKSGIPDTSAMMDQFRGGTSPGKEIFRSDSSNSATRATAIAPKLSSMVKGDLLFRRRGLVSGSSSGHVGFVYANDSSAQKVDLLDAASPSIGVGVRSMTYDFVSKNYTECWRPMLGAPDLSGNRNVPRAGQQPV